MNPGMSAGTTNTAKDNFRGEWYEVLPWRDRETNVSVAPRPGRGLTLCSLFRGGFVVTRNELLPSMFDHPWGIVCVTLTAKTVVVAAT